MRTTYETMNLLPVLQVERRVRAEALPHGGPRRRLRDVARAALDRLHPWGATSRPGREPSRPGRAAAVRTAACSNPSLSGRHQVPTSAA